MDRNTQCSGRAENPEKPPSKTASSTPSGRCRGNGESLPRAWEKLRIDGYDPYNKDGITLTWTTPKFTKNGRPAGAPRISDTRCNTRSQQQRRRGQRSRVADSTTSHFPSPRRTIGAMTFELVSVLVTIHHYSWKTAKACIPSERNHPPRVFGARRPHHVWSGPRRFEGVYEYTPRTGSSLGGKIFPVSDWDGYELVTSASSFEDWPTSIMCQTLEGDR